MHEENYASRFKYSARRLKKNGVCLFQAQEMYGNLQSITILHLHMDFTPLILLKGLSLPKKFFTSNNINFVYPDFSIYVGHEEGSAYFWVGFDGSTSFTIRFKIQLRAYVTFRHDVEYDKSRLLFRKLKTWVERCIEASVDPNTESLSKHPALKYIEGSVLHGCLKEIVYELYSKVPGHLVTPLSLDEYKFNDLESLDLYEVKNFTVKVTFHETDL